MPPWLPAVQLLLEHSADLTKNPSTYSLFDIPLIVFKIMEEEDASVNRSTITSKPLILDPKSRTVLEDM